MGERFRPPEGQYCDVVMKGGITSGVVYPKAICALAERYRFRNVGGTSAGAIAAAATAAAEYGRDRDGGGFETLEGLPDFLGGDGNLIGLFQPQPSTRRLHRVLIASMDAKQGGWWKIEGWKNGRWKKKVALLKALVPYAAGIVLGALPGVLIAAMLVVLGALYGSGWFLGGAIALAVPAMIFALLGAALGAGLLLLRDLNVRVPENGYGLCSGMPTRAPQPGEARALTPWLHETIETCAGDRDRPASRPLTFGDLWAAPGQTLADLKTEDDHHINLAMMTTNLVNRRAHQMPWDDRDWFFCPAELSKLFPADVVRHMVENPREPNASELTRSLVGRGLAWRQGLRPLPEAKDMPVLVATRMSLSFPVLLTGVPLWRFDYSWKDNSDRLDEWRAWGAALADQGDGAVLEYPNAWSPADPPAEPAVFERCWFSDGGISSNFPVHFFDRLVPRWPTFAIDLRPFAFGDKPSPDEAENVEMAHRNGDQRGDWWYRFPEPSSKWFGLKDQRLRSFLEAAVKTMQNRADEAQMRVPGYRDRVAHVNMSKTEGGMNLNMEEGVIKALTKRGEAAADRLITAYDPEKWRGRTISWRNHRWTRFRSSLAVLEQLSTYFAAGVKESDYLDGDQALIDHSRTYKLEPWQKPLARKEVERVEELAAAVGEATVQQEPPGMQFEAPKPPPVGRISPKE
jgi:predicted acylesterase/phospholipase RssA